MDIVNPIYFPPIPATSTVGLSMMQELALPTPPLSLVFSLYSRDLRICAPPPFQIPIDIRGVRMFKGSLSPPLILQTLPTLVKPRVIPTKLHFSHLVLMIDIQPLNKMLLNNVHLVQLHTMINTHSSPTTCKAR